MATYDFDYGYELEPYIIFNIIYVLPIEYDTVFEVTKEEENGLAEELAKHKPL